MVSAGVWALWIASVQLGGLVLWFFSRIDMRSKVSLKRQIACQVSKDIALYRDCLRYCTGASLSQGKVSLSSFFRFYSPWAPLYLERSIKNHIPRCSGVSNTPLQNASTTYIINLIQTNANCGFASICKISRIKYINQFYMYLILEVNLKHFYNCNVGVYGLKTIPLG